MAGKKRFDCTSEIKVTNLKGLYVDVVDVKGAAASYRISRVLGTN